MMMMMMSDSSCPLVLNLLAQHLAQTAADIEFRKVNEALLLRHSVMAKDQKVERLTKHSCMVLA